MASDMSIFPSSLASAATASKDGKELRALELPGLCKSGKADYKLQVFKLLFIESEDTFHGLPFLVAAGIGITALELGNECFPFSLSG